MTPNPLVGSAPDPKSPTSAVEAKPAHVVHLVSNAPPSQVQGLESFLLTFNSGTAQAEVVQFRHVIQRTAKRALGGKFGKGLSTQVTENIEINLNQDLFGLRRWLGNVRHDPSNVLLLSAGKVKDEALAAPLVFSELIRTGRPILVTGIDATSRDQLMATVDLKCEHVPPEVERNYSLKTMLLARIQRRKGFVNSLRGLMDLEFLPKETQDKINQVATGADPSTFSEAELINIALLADLTSRYQAILEQFRDFVQNSSIQVSQLVSCFELMMADTSPELTIEAFKPFLKDALEDGAEIASKSQLFGHLYRFLTGTGDEARRTQDRAGVFYRTLRNTFLRRRSQIDPMLWRRCCFLGAFGESEQKTLAPLRPYVASLDKWISEGLNGTAAEASRETGRHIYRLARLANQDPGVMREEAQFAEHRMANRLLPHFKTKSFNTEKLTYPSPVAQALPGEVEQFLQEYEKRPISDEDLKQIRAGLAPIVRPEEHTKQVLERSVVEVIQRHAREREQVLREIYILNAAATLTKYPFHLGPHVLNSVERACAVNVLPARLGLEVHPHSVSEFSVGLFGGEQEAPLGKLENDPLTLARAYALLMGLRVEDVVRRIVDHKINYFIRSYGEKFFEVIYERVVRRNDIPLSEAQLAHMLKERNVLGSLDEKGLRSETLHDYADPFLSVGFRPSHSIKKKAIELPKELEEFETEYADSLKQFRELLNDLKASAEADPSDENPKRLIWGFYKQGIYNLSQESARKAFRKTVFHRYLQELIARISSENYSIFHRDTAQEGLKIYLPRTHGFLLTIGDRFSFLDSNTVVKYRLLPSPEEKPEKLDDISRTFLENFDAYMGAEEKEPWVEHLAALAAQLKRAHDIWSRFSRNLSLALLDRVISATINKQLQPDKIEAKHLFYLPDPVKLCLGKATVGEESVPFTKILQRPDIIGNIAKNPNISSSTIDDFAIEVQKIDRVSDELRTMSGLIEDVVDIINTLGHDRSELANASTYEKHLLAMQQILHKPMRDLGEHDVQALHAHANKIKETLESLYNSPSQDKHKLVNRIQAELETRRSDRHTAKLNFTDAFLLDKTTVAVRQMVEKDGQRVAVRKKKEVELEATHQTLPLRIRQVVGMREFINRKKYVVFAPEGQKRKQIDYVLDAIDTLLTMRGQAVGVYVDTNMMAEEQVHTLATRVKPHNFFDMNDITPEPPPGMKTNVAIDPLSGKAVRTPTAKGEGQPQPAAAPREEPTEFACTKDPSVVYRYDPAAKAYFLKTGDGEAKALALPVDLGKPVRSAILMVKQPSGRPLFHGLLGNEVLLPNAEKPEPPTICAFQFIDRTVRIVNEAGKPVVKVEREEGGFLDELRDIG